MPLLSPVLNHPLVNGIRGGGDGGGGEIVFLLDSEIGSRQIWYESTFLLLGGSGDGDGDGDGGIEPEEIIMPEFYWKSIIHGGR